MVCPNCQNKGFVPTEEIKKCLQNTGHKRYYRTFITRRYFCYNCGFAFMTKEEFYQPLTRRKEQLDLFNKEK